MQNNIWIRALTSTLLTCALSLLAACGGAATSAPDSTLPVGISEPVVAVAPEIPDDLWLLVPENAIAVIDVDVARLREWAHYATVRRWMAQYACVQEGQWTALLDRVDRAVGSVGAINTQKAEGVLLLRGHFTEADRDVIAAEVDGDAVVEQRGFWAVRVGKDELIALLDEHTLVVAVGPWRDQVLNLASTTGARGVREAAFVRDLAPRVQGDNNVVVAMAAPPADVASDVLHDLSRWGGSAAAIAKGLAAMPYWGVRANLLPDNGGVAAFAAASGGTEGGATALAEALKTAFWQAGLFMRLIGLPPILANAALQHTGPVTTLGLQANASESATLLTRLEELVKSAAPPCTATPEIAASPNP